MTDQQMPGWMLRDHANLADAYKQHIHDGGESALGDFLRDEAARREGEAQKPAFDWMAERDGICGLPRPTAPDGKELEQAATERDRAEEAFSQAFYIVTGRSPEWSNLFGYAEALEEFTDAIEALRARAEAAEADAKRLRKLASAMLAKTGVVLDRPVPPVGAPAVFVEYDAARALWDELAKGGNDDQAK